MRFLPEVISLLVVLSQAALSSTECPFSSKGRSLSQSRSPPPSVVSALILSVLGGQTLIENYQESAGQVAVVNFDDVRTDLRTVMTDSQEVGLSPARATSHHLACSV